MASRSKRRRSLLEDAPGVTVARVPAEPVSPLAIGDLWPMQMVNLTADVESLRCVSFMGMVPAAELGDCLGAMFRVVGMRIQALREQFREAEKTPGWGMAWGPGGQPTIEVRIQLSITNARNL